MKIIIKRIYLPAAPEDGQRVLVDRLWPRGISRQRASLEEWMKEIAPSQELREWFGHRPERFEAFKTDYTNELRRDPVKQEAVKKLLAMGQRGTVTLLYGAKDPAMNQAVVLQQYLRAQPSASQGPGIASSA